ncbi:MAG: hypothetical protein U0Y10_02105 [Spirosomataceae bacterium]
MEQATVGLVSAGFSSSVEDPSRNSATTSMSGVYSVTVNGTGGCTGTATTSVVVNPLPVAVATGPIAVCVGASLCLTGSGGGTYSWRGPNGFSSTAQNPCRSSVTTSDAGVYSLTVSLTTGCSASATVSVGVNTATATASSNSPVCTGTIINLSSTGGGLYSWTGSAGFSSTAENSN